ncbi:MAG: SCO family protein [Pseudomonadota bacterium]
MILAALRLFIFSTAALAVASCDRPDALGAAELSDAFRFEPDLIDTDGEPAAKARFVGERSVVYFGFANCPDVCPTALGRLTAALDLLDETGPVYEAYFITVDPERDTPGALADYLAFDERITGLSGEPENVRALLEDMHVYAEREDLPESAIGYTMAHTSLFYVIDEAGAPTHAIVDRLTPQELADTLRAVAR